MTRIAIVGGGIAGLSAAAALSPFAQVTLLEREKVLGYHASGRSAAMFEENYGNAAVKALNRASKPVHEAAGVLSPRGILMVAMEEEIPAFESDLDDMAMTEVSVAHARAQVPILSDAIRRAAVHEGASDIDTDRLLQACAKTARRNGARLETGAEVLEIERGSSWRLRHAREVVEADILVDAAGAWAEKVAEMAGAGPLGLTPFRRSMARLPAPGGHDVRGWPMLFGAGETWYAKPDAGGWIVSPADEDAVEPMDAWADDLVLAEGLARYEAHVTEPVRRISSNWAGLRTFAPDRALVIGPDQQAEGFFWLAGQGGYGFQTAPAAAGLLVSHVLGRASALPDDVVEALSPSRFRRSPECS